jgi:hypothetical protein
VSEFITKSVKKICNLLQKVSKKYVIYYKKCQKYYSCIAYSAFLIKTLFARLYVKVGILLTCGKDLHGRIISLRGELYAHRTSLIPPPLFIEVSMPGQERERSCICVLRVSMLPLYWILELGRQCGIYF